MTINYAEYVAGLVKRASAAQKIAEGFDQAKVDELCAAVAYVTTRPDFAQKAAEMLVAEGGMGVAADKVGKMYTKIKGTYRDMKGQPSVGLVETNEATGMYKFAKPMGVIGAIIPITNGEATPIVKALCALKTRNAIILAPHPKAAKTNLWVTNAVREVLKKYGAPEDLVIPIEAEYVSIECSGELMKQCNFIMATGGTPMVRSAYSSGTPAVGVGTGNCITLVDGTTDLDEVADKIFRSKTFDNATSCSTENGCVVFESTYDAFVKAMEKKGGFLIKEGSPEKERLQKAVWPEWPANHALSREIVAQSVKKIASLADIKINDNTTFLMVEENRGTGHDYPFTGEKLSVITTLIKCKDFEDGLNKMEACLNYQGMGHSCGIHSTNMDYAMQMADRMKVTKICINQPQSLANSGAWTNGFPMSMTLGCGTWGFNSISHNATWKDLLNFTYMSKPIPSTQPTDEELFPEAVRKFNA